MQELNKELLIYLNSLLDFPIIENISLLFADIPIFFLPLFLVITWVYYTYKDKNIKKKKDLLFLFYSCIIAIVINFIIQYFIHIDRPETVIEWVWKLLLDHIPNASFPSDHAAVSVAFLLGLFYARFTKTAIFFAIPVIIMNISRVILGVHWPLDILCGMLIWIISALISFKILKKINIVENLNNYLLKIASYIKL